jgi:glycerophosphoryl diester phosphodiesterase
LPAAPRRLRAVVVVWLVALGACGDAAPTPTEPVTTGAPPIAVDVHGHRGARGLEPENTLPAFEVALDAGVDALELDLHFTADDVVVVWHDPTVDPAKCGLDPEAGEGALDPDDADATDLAIAALTLAELDAYRCDRNPDRGRFPDQSATGTALAGDDYRIVTLAELFEFVAEYAASDLKTAEQRSAASTVDFNIETKRVPDRPETIGDGFDGVTPGAFELAILDAAETAGVTDRVIIQSFDHRSLEAIRTVDGAIRLAALTRRNEPYPPDLAGFAQIWSPDHRSLSADDLREAHEAGVLVIPWTVNEPRDMNRLIDLGVDGLITDFPDVLVQIIEERS